MHYPDFFSTPVHIGRQSFTAGAAPHQGHHETALCGTLRGVRQCPMGAPMPLFKRTLSEFIFRRFMLKHYSSNLLVDMNLEAKRDTLEYIKANMVDAPYFEKHPALVSFALDQVAKPGLYLEFGVGRGKLEYKEDVPPSELQQKARRSKLISLYVLFVWLLLPCG